MLSIGEVVMKRSGIRMTIGMIAALLLVATLAGPAAALGNAVGAFDGVAQVGKWFDTSVDTDGCDKNGFAIPTGRGLYFPGVDGQKLPDQSYGEGTVPRRENNGVFAFQSSTLVAVGQSQAGDGVFTGFVNVCGYLSHVPNTLAKKENRHSGLGAACGASKGHHGKGLAHIVNVATGAVADLKLYDIGWKAAVGGALPILGGYQEYHPTKPVKKDKFGTIMGVVNARGGALDCAGEANNGNGAQSFAVDGEFELINGNDTHWNEVSPKPKENGGDLGDDRKRCKGSAPTGPTKDHSLKPAKGECKPKGPQK